MRIIQLVGWYFPDSVGGTEVYVAGLSAQLIRSGHTVTVAAPQAGISAPHRYRHEGVEVFRYPIPDDPTRDEARGIVAVRGSEYLAGYLAAERPDIVHFHTFTTGLGLRELSVARATGARVVATGHLPSIGFLCNRGTLMRWGKTQCDGLVLEEKCAACSLQLRGIPILPSKALAKAGRLLHRPLKAGTGRGRALLEMGAVIRHRLQQQHEMMSGLDKLVLLNQFTRSVAEANGASPRKLSVNFLGHSIPGLVPKPGPDLRPTDLPLVVGFVGRIHHIKGIGYLLEAMKMLPRDLPIRLEIRAIANGPDEIRLLQNLRAAATRLGNVGVEDGLSSSEVGEAMKSFDVLCIPSVSFENGPTVMMEAHAAGTPVIGTRLGAMPERIVDGVNGRLLEPRNSRQIAMVLESIVRDPRGTIDAWRKELPKPRTMVEIAADYQAMYQEIVAGAVHEQVGANG